MQTKKIAVVTGGNRGIGREVCRQLAAAGVMVVLTARDFDKAEKVSDELTGEVIPFKLDVTDAGDSEALYRFLLDSYNHLDILVNNAGTNPGAKGLITSDIEEIQSVYNANFFGPLIVVKALYSLLAKSDSGRIINVASGMGALKDLSGNYAAYRLSKAGLNAQTIILADELKHTNIKVNSVCPGWVRTDMGGSTAPRSVEQGAETIVWLALEKDIPTGKFFRDKKEISF